MLNLLKEYFNSLKKRELQWEIKNKNKINLFVLITAIIGILILFNHYQEFNLLIYFGVFCFVIPLFLITIGEFFNKKSFFYLGFIVMFLSMNIIFFERKIYVVNVWATILMILPIYGLIKTIMEKKE